jgi:hypothetical protein
LSAVPLQLCPILSINCLSLIITIDGRIFIDAVRGMMYYRKALELQAFLDMAKDEGD